MVKTIDTLVSDIHVLLDGHDLSEAIEKFKDDIGSMLVRRFREHGLERRPTLRMSNLGKKNRQLWYELNGYPGEKLSAEAKTKFLFGDVIETLFLFLAEQAGHEVTDMQKEVVIDGVVGHIDAKIDGVVFDVKSASSRSFEKFENRSLLKPENDPFGYVQQLDAYRQALGEKDAAWLAIDKQLGKICVLKLPQEQTTNVPDRIAEIRTAIARPDAPERCYDDIADGKSGNRRLSTGCSYCNYRFECWKDANDGHGLKTYYYSNGPRYLTKVVREPRVDLHENPFPNKYED